MIRLWLLGAALMLPLAALAQPGGKVHRIGVIHLGGAYEAVLQGMRAGMKEAGLTEGKQFILHVRNTRGSLRDVESSAKQLVDERVDLLFTITTSATVAAKKATRDIPIVFYAGNDPVRVGLVKSFAQPGERLTGVHHRATDLTAKRLEAVRRVLPKARRVVMFFNPDVGSARDGLVFARDVAPKLGFEIVERPVKSAEELLAGMRALRAGEVDVFVTSGDAIQTSTMPQVLPLARERNLPVVMQDLNLVQSGALMAYGANYLDVGRSAAKPIQRILAGAKPQDIPVEIYDKVQLALNLRVAKELGLTIPQPVILRADQVIH